MKDIRTKVVNVITLKDIRTKVVTLNGFGKISFLQRSHKYGGQQGQTRSK